MKAKPVQNEDKAAEDARNKARRRAAFLGETPSIPGTSQSELLLGDLIDGNERSKKLEREVNLLSAEEEKLQEAINDPKEKVERSLPGPTPHAWGDGADNLDADFWRDFHDKFKALADEEKTEEAWRNNRWLYTIGDYTGPEELEYRSGLPVPARKECGIWALGNGVSEAFRARFDAVATRAGLKLRPPSGTTPLDYWLHRTFQDLLENKSALLRGADKTGGIIERLCEASATFCARLETKALETSASAEDEKRGKARSTQAASIPMNHLWDQIDHNLVSLKHQEAADLLHKEADELRRQVYSRFAKNRNAASIPAGILDAELKMAGKWAETVLSIYVSVWVESQRKNDSPEFRRVVFEKGILPVLEAREGSARDFLENRARQTNQSVGPHLAELSRALARLKDSWRRKTEIEAKELEQIQKRRAAISTPRHRDSSRKKRPLSRGSRLGHFQHSDDYRSIQFQGKHFSLTSRQAQVVEMLHRAYEGGTPELSQAHILEELGSPSSRLRDTFKNTELWGKNRLIVSGGCRGTVRLNLPNPTKK